MASTGSTGRESGFQSFRCALQSFLESAKVARALRHGAAVELDEATIKKLRRLGWCFRYQVLAAGA